METCPEGQLRTLDGRREGFGMRGPQALLPRTEKTDVVSFAGLPCPWALQIRCNPLLAVADLGADPFHLAPWR